MTVYQSNISIFHKSLDLLTSSILNNNNNNNNNISLEKMKFNNVVLLTRLEQFIKMKGLQNGKNAILKRTTDISSRVNIICVISLENFDFNNDVLLTRLE